MMKLYLYYLTEQSYTNKEREKKMKGIHKNICTQEI